MYSHYLVSDCELATLLSSLALVLRFFFQSCQSTVCLSPFLISRSFSLCLPFSFLFSFSLLTILTSVYTPVWLQCVCAQKKDQQKSVVWRDIDLHSFCSLKHIHHWLAKMIYHYQEGTDCSSVFIDRTNRTRALHSIERGLWLFAKLAFWITKVTTVAVLPLSVMFLCGFMIVSCLILSTKHPLTAWTAVN